MSTIDGSSVKNEAIQAPIFVPGNAIKEWLNQPHKHYAEKNEIILNIGEVLGQARCPGYGPFV